MLPTEPAKYRKIPPRLGRAAPTFMTLANRLDVDSRKTTHGFCRTLKDLLSFPAIKLDIWTQKTSYLQSFEAITAAFTPSPFARTEKRLAQMRASTENSERDSTRQYPG